MNVEMKIINSVKTEKTRATEQILTLQSMLDLMIVVSEQLAGQYHKLTNDSSNEIEQNVLSEIVIANKHVGLAIVSVDKVIRKDQKREKNNEKN